MSFTITCKPTAMVDTNLYPRHLMVHPSRFPYPTRAIRVLGRFPTHLQSYACQSRKCQGSTLSRLSSRCRCRQRGLSLRALQLCGHLQLTMLSILNQTPRLRACQSPSRRRCRVPSHPLPPRRRTRVHHALPRPTRSRLQSVKASRSRQLAKAARGRLQSHLCRSRRLTPARAVYDVQQSREPASSVRTGRRSIQRWRT